jgi:phosphatidylserine/phosphatidylglycerophosphate/cardiolipin synthase-like enzyme
MTRRAQWRDGYIVAFLFFIFSWVGEDLLAEPLICPVIDRPGACSYCRCIEEAFAKAEVSIDLLLSNAELDENPLWDLLLTAASRGVGIRVLLDGSAWAAEITEKNRPTIEFLNDHGIEARFDDPDVTTHAKLVVIDRRTVILGSSNWNSHSFMEQEQANIQVEDEQVGAVFAKYFERLWEGTLHSEGINLDLSDLDGAEPLLVPIPDTVDTGNYASLLLTFFPQAKRSIHVLMYRISYYPTYRDSLSNKILDALVDGVRRGLDVKVLLDDCAFYPDSAEANLEAALYLLLHGVEVCFDDPAKTTHAKLVIVDGESVLLGSTNWNYYALEKNNEVALALLHLPAVASPYEEFFFALWRAGRPLAGR